MSLSQKEMLLEHFKKGKRLTAAGAIDMFGVMSLSSRVRELRNAGYNIKTRKVEVRNKFNSPIVVTQYWMEPTQPAETPAYQHPSSIART